MVSKGFLTGLLFICAAAMTGAQNASARTELEGTWIGRSMATEGQAQLLGRDEMRLTFKGDQLTHKGLAGDREFETPFSVNLATSPKHLDFTLPPNARIEAIYELDGDVLRIGMPRPRRPRPVALNSEPGSNTIVIELRRQAP
jgi:uncharacterized protein (TIGR03067 family)